MIGNWNGSIKTKRLILKTIQTNDLPALFEYAKDPQVSTYTMWEPHESLEDTQDYFLSYILPNNQVGVAEPLGVYFEHQPDQLIGTVGFFYSAESHRSIELAYALNPTYWGQGIIVEASIALLDWGLQHYEINRIQSRCKSPNAASRRVMEKIGFIYEGTKRESLRHRQLYWDMLEYSILVREWMNRYPKDFRIIRSAKPGLAEDLWTWSGFNHNKETGKVQTLLSLDETHAEIISLQTQNSQYHLEFISSVVDSLKIHGLSGVSVNADLFKQNAKLFQTLEFDSSGFLRLGQA